MQLQSSTKLLGELASKRAAVLRQAKSTSQPSTDEPSDALDVGAVGSFDWDTDQREWLARAFEGLTSELKILSPSEWAEAKRYLPPSVTSLPGFYRFEVAPYIREILDCMGVESPIRHVSVMKGVQLCLTVGVLENAIGYYIDHVRTSPCMLVTADAELAKLRMDSYIAPMIEHSGLSGQIKSTDQTRTRRTGHTDKKLEWEGGGFLVPFGAQNANKLRSLSIQILLRDEVDGWPLRVGRDGDPMKLSEDRTAGYQGSRKVVDISTPLVKGVSKIEEQYKLGDQRKYLVCCLKCKHPQELRWRRTSSDGEVTGIVWKMKNKRLVPGSVRYLCENCAHPHTNDDKTKLLQPENGAYWKPTAEPATPDRRSYHINALYSPVGMQTWASCVLKWLEAWDDETNKPKDLGLLQVFYNNVLGESFELRGEKLKMRNVSPHRRDVYKFGEIPNKFAEETCGGPILLLTCAVDVHKDNLAVGVVGWTRDRRAFLIDYWRFEGDTEQLTDEGTWGALRNIIEETKVYTADDGRKYRVQLTLVDSGYRTDQVYSFCSEYESGVFPCKGRDVPAKSATVKEFHEFVTPMGTTAYGITVDFYKDRWSAALRRRWSGQGHQPVGQFNAPRDITDKQLKELTVEVKREVVEKVTGKRKGFEWHRPGGAANELWDLLVYNNAALDLIAWNVCRGQLEMEYVNWPAFFDMALEQHPYFTNP